MTHWEAAAVELCAAIAEKILRHELSRAPELALAIIHEALQLAAGQPHVKLRLHPADLELLQQMRRGGWALRLAAWARASWFPTRRFRGAGCLIETRHGVIDARLETQLERITSSCWREIRCHVRTCRTSPPNSSRGAYGQRQQDRRADSVGRAAFLLRWGRSARSCARTARRYAEKLSASATTRRCSCPMATWPEFVAVIGDAGAIGAGNSRRRPAAGRVLDGRGPVRRQPAVAAPAPSCRARCGPRSAFAATADQCAAGDGHSRDRRPADVRQRAAAGNFCRQRRGEKRADGQMARSSTADVNVVVLVGERGREVREFLEKDLGPDGLARSVVVAATSDEPALIRLRAAYVGTAIAEYFRDAGRDVLLMMDSVTRFALAQREIGLAAGEPPATRGYPPSVFALLPRLLERSGKTDRGSITGFYTVLVEADDANEPISDTVRGILDGHIMLSRKLAHQAHWPAIDVLSSISRSMPDVTSEEHRRHADSLKQLLAAYQESQDLISIGAYQSGSNPLVDAAIRMRDETMKFLRQGISEPSHFSRPCRALPRCAQIRNNLMKQNK